MGRGFGERLSLLDRAVTIRELSVGRDKEQDAGLRAVVLQACAKCYEEAGLYVEAEARWIKCGAAFEKVKMRINTSPFYEFEALSRTLEILNATRARAPLTFVLASETLLPLLYWLLQ